MTRTCDAPSVALIGDVGGHLELLVAALTELGVDVRGARVPEGLTVVQVGDLIHRGPDSVGVATLVNRFLARDPESWVQLVGNHESQLLPGGTQFFPEPGVDAACAPYIRQWWQAGVLRVGYAFDSPAATGAAKDSAPSSAAGSVGGVLVTHAGLTAGAWQLIGGPADAHQAVRVLNGVDGDLPTVVWREGEVITGVFDSAAGPLWATANEVLRSWADQSTAPPFSQVFGHSQMCQWDERAPAALTPGIARTVRAAGAAASMDSAARQIRVTYDEGPSLWSIDPAHGIAGAASWAPLVLRRRSP